ncbi:MAG: metallophosphoesterase [Lachnospiraceae bacterium]|nr:metallophosphoesterase [Lachnospiraceae bacterium]
MVYLIISLILLLITALVIFVIRESRGFCSVYYSVITDKLSHDLKIVMLSDLHNKDYGNENEALVSAIRDFDPDLICFAGDMVTSAWDTNLDYRKTLSFIRKLSSDYPVYYGMGNHEQAFNEDREKHPEAFERLKKALDEMGVRLLDNEHLISADPEVMIYGLNLPYEYYRKIATKHLKSGLMHDLLGDVDREKYSILLAHNPEHFKEYAAWGCDLILSGHIHGGIIRLPYLGGVISPGIKLFPKYDSGLFTSGKTTMLVSRGIGSHTIPVRINNKAEIVCLTIKGEHT